MKVWHLVQSLTLVALAVAFIIDPSVRSHIGQLKESALLFRDKLKQELKALTSPQSQLFSQKTLVDNDFVVVPSDSIDSETLRGLGVNQSEIQQFAIGNGKIQIPQHVKTLFLLNTSEPLSIPSESMNSFTSFLKSSLPFSLPKHMALANYFLVLPRSHLRSAPQAFNHTLATFGDAMKYPLFSSALAEKAPVMVFMLTDSACSSNQATNGQVSDSAEQTSVSRFFNSIASQWVTKGRFPNLINSVFCKIHSETPDDSYCLQVHDNKTLRMFPAFFKFNVLNRSVGSASFIWDEKVEATAIKQLHDKLSYYADRFNDITYDLATEPKPAILKADKKIDKKVHEVQESIGHKIQEIEDKKSSVKQKIKNEVNDLMRDTVELQSSDSSSEFSKVKRNGNISRFLDEAHVSIPLAILQPSQVELHARNSQYSQVVYGTLHKRFSVFSSDENCEEITWYNVFHHSIFGKPKFCLKKSS